MEIKSAFVTFSRISGEWIGAADPGFCFRSGCAIIKKQMCALFAGRGGAPAAKESLCFKLEIFLCPSAEIWNN